jgi:hypothetical protein
VAALVDDDELLLAAKGVTFRYPLVLLVNMIEQSLAAIAVPKGLAHAFPLDAAKIQH